MKKYAIIIGENNEELSKQVQEALFEAGFKWQDDGVGVKYTHRWVMYLNYNDPTEMTACCAFARNSMSCAVIAPSYVLEHAAELDGATKPWEIPPEGYRLVTEEERATYSGDVGGIPTMLHTRKGLGWRLFTYTKMSFSDISYAVPTSYVFEKPVEEITMEELCKKLGYDVKIVKK